MAKLTFIKMSGCGHCVKFFAEGRNDGPWMKLKNDPEFKQQGIQFEMLEFGKGKLLPGDLKYRDKVKYAPYFNLESNGQNYEYGKNDISYNGIRNWLKSKLVVQTKSQNVVVVQAKLKSKKKSISAPKKNSIVKFRSARNR